MAQLVPSSTDILTIEVEQSHDSAVVTLKGELDLSGSPLLREHLVRLTEMGVYSVVMDLSELTFIDSTGLGVFIMDWRRLTVEGGSFVVRGPRPRVRRIFEIAGLAPMLDPSS
jgi:anti-sigma B factor antagonist